MKSYLFTTETDRGGVMLCDIEDFDTAVTYLCKRFDGVVKIESAEQVWQLTESDQLSSDVITSESEIAESQTLEHREASPASDDLFA